MPSVTYPNGRIPQSALDPVPAAGGQTAWLLPLVAAALMRVAAECDRLYGWTPRITSAGDGFRSYQRQRTVFLQRYRTKYSTVMQGGRRIVDRRVWDGRAYYRFTGAAAAVPGTSNHGLGITVDLTGLGGFAGLRFRQIAPILVRHGFSNTEGASIGESWHWNYTRAAYPVANTNRPGSTITIPTVGGNLPAPLTPEDDEMSAEDSARLTRIENMLTDPNTGLWTFGGGPSVRAIENRIMYITDGAASETAKLATKGDLAALGASLRDDVTLVQMTGGKAFWAPVAGVARAWVTQEMLGARYAGATVVPLYADNEFWDLPLTPGGFVGELFKREGDPTGAAYWRTTGGIRWVPRGEYEVMGEPLITNLPVDHPLWSLPVFGATPPKAKAPAPADVTTEKEPDHHG